MKDPVSKEEIISGSKAKKACFIISFSQLQTILQKQNPTANHRSKRWLSQLKLFSEGIQHFGGELAAACTFSTMQFLSRQKTTVRSAGWDSWGGFCSLFRDRQCTTHSVTNNLLKLDILLKCLIKLQIFLLHFVTLFSWYHLFGYQRFASTTLLVFYFVKSFPGCLLHKVKENTKSYW